MTKYLLLGVWICVLCLGAAYVTMTMTLAPDADPGKAQSQPVSIEQVKTKRLNIPIIGDGQVKGYVLAQFVFHINADMAKDLSARPDLFLVDEAFKVIFSGEAIDFERLEKPDASGLSKAIKRNVNERFGPEFLQEVLVQELNYIPQERFRGGSLAEDSSFA